MSFIIRQVARRADGGEIVRTRTAVTAQISVGRGTDCDIQLPDLAVMLRHARLVITGPGRVSVEAIGGVPVNVGGSFVTRADLLVADAPAVDIGPFRLSLSAGEDGAVAVTAARVVPPIEAADAAAETEIFSLQGAMPGKRRLAWIGAGLVLVAMLLLPLLHFLAEDRAVLPPAMLAQARQPATHAASDAGQAFGDGRLHVPRARPAAQGGFAADEVWSSGPLSNAHASLSGNCGACHQQAFVSVTDSACQACHVKDALPDHALPARMARGRLPAGGIVGAAHKAFNLPEGRCTSCHKEHEGEATLLAVGQGFCTDCHAGLKSRLPDTPLADVPGWKEHPDFRATLVATPSSQRPIFTRARLGGAPGQGAQERSGLIYPHALHQSATNAVANMAQKQGLPTGNDGALPCRYCHVPDAGQVRFQPISMEKNCGACHDLAFARDGGTLRTLPHGKPEQVAGIIRDFWASRSGRADVALFPRRPPGPAAAPAAVPAGRAEAAVAQIFTGRRFGDGIGARGICNDCHVVTDTGAADILRRFTIQPVTLNDHYLPQGRFPHGRHRSVEGRTGEAACLACHQGALTSKAATDVLVPGIANCRQCHGAPARALFASAPRAEARCDTCHAFHDGVNPPGGQPVRLAARPAT